MKRDLPLSGPTALGAPTIMDRALAQDHGVDYVRLAAFAIDLDRLYGQAPGDLPFGWEVFVVESYLLGALDPDDTAVVAMLEDACMHVLGQPPDAAVLGSHLVFAVYDAVARGALPQALEAVFHRWRSPPRDLVKSLSPLWRATESSLASLAATCISLRLEPAVAPTTLAALETMAHGQWPVPAPKGAS